MDDVMKAIGDRTRRDILRIVWRNELPAGRIAEHFPITRPGVSQHLRVLKAAGLLQERRDGTQRLYRARPEGLAELRTYVEALWDDGLARLKAAAEAEQRARNKKEQSDGTVASHNRHHRKAGPDRRAS